MSNFHENTHITSTVTYMAAQSITLFTGRCFLQLLKTHDKRHAKMSDQATNVPNIISMLEKYSSSSVFDSSMTKVLKAYAQLYSAYHKPEHFIIEPSVATPVLQKIATAQTQFTQLTEKYKPSDKESDDCIKILVLLSEMDKEANDLRKSTAETWQVTNALRYIESNQAQIASYQKMTGNVPEEYLRYLLEAEAAADSYNFGLSVEKTENDMDALTKEEPTEALVNSLYEPTYSPRELGFILAHYKKIALAPAYLKASLMKPFIGKATENMLNSIDHFINDYFSKYRNLVESAASQKTQRTRKISEIQTAKEKANIFVRNIVMRNSDRQIENLYEGISVIEHQVVERITELDSMFQQTITEFQEQGLETIAPFVKKGEYARALPKLQTRAMDDLELAKDMFAEPMPGVGQGLSLYHTLPRVDGKEDEFCVIQPLFVEMKNSDYYATFWFVNFAILRITEIMGCEHFLRKESLTSKQLPLKTRLINFCEAFDETVALLAKSPKKDAPARIYRQAVAPHCAQILGTLESSLDYSLQSQNFNTQAYQQFLYQFVGKEELIKTTATVFGVPEYQVTDNISSIVENLQITVEEPRDSIPEPEVIDPVQVSKSSRARKKIARLALKHSHRSKFRKLLIAQKKKIQTAADGRSVASSIESGYYSEADEPNLLRKQHEREQRQIQLLKNGLATLMMEVKDGDLNLQIGELQQRVSRANSSEEAADHLALAYNDPSLQDHPVALDRIRQMYIDTLA